MISAVSDCTSCNRQLGEFNRELLQKRTISKVLSHPASAQLTRLRLTDSHRRARQRLAAARASARPRRCGPSMQENMGILCQRGLALGHPPPNPSPPLPLPSTRGLTTHHTTAGRSELCAELALPSSLAQAHHHRATDADLLRSGELVDEPGSGAGPRRAYPSLHHVRPASVLRVPFSWRHPLTLTP